MPGSFSSGPDVLELGPAVRLLDRLSEGLVLPRQSRLGRRQNALSCEAIAVSFWKAEQLLALATLVAARHAGVTLDDVDRALFRL